LIARKGVLVGFEYGFYKLPFGLASCAQLPQARIMNEAGELMRYAFEEHMKVFGEDFHAGGETRRAVYSDHKGIKKISFLPGEFPLRVGDVIKRWTTEENFKVVSAKDEAVAGAIINFHAVVLPQN
jgi:hypothetical protein